MLNIMTIKFIFIVTCFTIAILSYFICCSKKDWGWLTAGLLFTVGADYFLVIHNLHLPGVAVFCFAHICYILRVADISKRAKKLVMAIAFVWVLLLFVNNALFMLAGTYAVLFAVNIAFNVRYFRQKNTLLPKFNKVLVLAGLILFVLCDINVALFNLPRQFDMPDIFPQAFYLIWVFYLPSQLLLAVSGIAFPKAKE